MWHSPMGPSPMARSGGSYHRIAMSPCFSAKGIILYLHLSSLGLGIGLGLGLVLGLGLGLGLGLRKKSIIVVARLVTMTHSVIFKRM